MTITTIDASESFYKIARILDEIHSRTSPNSPLSVIINEFYPTLNSSRARIMAIKEFDNCIERVTLTNLKEARIAEIVAHLMAIQEEFLTKSSLGSAQEFVNSFNIPHTSAILKAYGDTIDTSLNATSSPLDRKQFLADTRELFDELSSLNIPEYASKALRLKLSSLMRMLEVCDGYSDDEIRTRIKSIYADFCAEFLKLDKSYESSLETMTRWAKKGFVNAGLLSLGLIADATAVAGLLTADPPPAQLPPPSEYSQSV